MYSIEYEKLLISMLLSDPEMWAKCSPHFKPEYFNDSLVSTVKFIKTYTEQYGKHPSEEQISATTGTPISKFSEPLEHTKAGIEKFDQFVQDRDMEGIILDGLEYLKQGRKAELVDRIVKSSNLCINTDHAFDGIWIDECEKVDPPSYLIANWLVQDSVTCVYGAPGSYKSFFCLEAAMCLATGRPFAGQRVAQTSVAYVAAEGQRGIALRLEALCEAHQTRPDRTSLRLITQPLDLLDDDTVSKFIQYIRNLESIHHIHFGLIVLDTYSQCISGADENSQATASKASSNMIRIRRELGTTVLYVHHTGKDASKGMRGSDALRANTDAAIEITRDEHVNNMAATAVVVRSKDAPIGDRMRFNMKFVKVPRFDNQPINGSLVPEFLKEQPINSDPHVPSAGGKTISWSQDILNQMSEGEIIPVKRILTLTRRDTSTHYKDKLAAMLPLGAVVDVHDEDGVVLGAIGRIEGTRPNNKFGDIKCFSKG